MRYDPIYFNLLLIGLYTLNTLNWLWAKNYPQALYWFAAALITASVTWGLKA
jgi:hypothetical protein